MSNSDTRTIWYLDTSVALRILLRHSASAVSWFNQRVEAGDQFVSSRLLELEMMRVFRREQLATNEVTDFVRGFTLMRLDDALAGEAAAIRPHLKTLDVLHLASALRIGTGAVTIVTHDAGMKTAAEALGFQVLDPVG